MDFKDFKEDFPTDEERAVLKLACENSLKVYIKIMHKYLTGASFTFKPFHDEVIQALEARAKFTTTKNLLLNLPVGFGKSIIIEYFKSWCYARNKNLCFLYTSYSDKLIIKLSSEIIEIMKSEVYQILWGYRFKKDKKSKANWSIEGSVGRAGLTAGSIGGTITGLDAGNPAIDGFCGAMIIDDPMKAGDEIYETKRELVVEHFTKKLKTRLRRNDVPIILIMQRLHEEDLTGYIKNLPNWQESWDCITVQALVNEKSIWEEKITTKDLIYERENQPFVFYPQRQQEPNSNINSSFKGLTLATDEEAKNIVNGYGHTDKGFDGDDGTAFTIIKEKDDCYYVFGKLWQKKHIDDCKDEIFALRDKYKCGTIYTENNDDKGYLAKNNKGVSAYHEHQNKHFKIMTYLYPAWKKIRFLKETDDAYIKQIQYYNEQSKHDDAPDSCASLIRLLKNVTKVEGPRPF